MKTSTAALFGLTTTLLIAGCGTMPSRSQSVRSVSAPTPTDTALLTPAQATEAKQAARRFLEAVRDEDWHAVAGFWPLNARKHVDEVFTDTTERYMAGLEIIHLGAPSKQSSHPWVFVPYEIRFRNGDTQTDSLRIEQLPDGHWVWEGGF